MPVPWRTTVGTVPGMDTREFSRGALWVRPFLFLVLAGATLAAAAGVAFRGAQVVVGTVLSSASELGAAGHVFGQSTKVSLPGGEEAHLEGVSVPAGAPLAVEDVEGVWEVVPGWGAQLAMHYPAGLWGVAATLTVVGVLVAALGILALIEVRRSPESSRTRAGSPEPS